MDSQPYGGQVERRRQRTTDDVERAADDEMSSVSETKPIRQNEQSAKVLVGPVDARRWHMTSSNFNCSEHMIKEEETPMSMFDCCKHEATI